MLIAAAIAIVLFFIFGGAGRSTDAALAEQLFEKYQNPVGLLFLIPTILVIVLTVKGGNIFVALGTGIVAAIVIGLSFGLFDFT